MRVPNAGQVAVTELDRTLIVYHEPCGPGKYPRLHDRSEEMTIGTLFSNGPLCPFTHRVLIAARELNAPVDVVYGNGIPQHVRDANTSGTWPAFAPADGGELFQDSADIIDHLIERSGERGETYDSDPVALTTLDDFIVCIRKVLTAGDTKLPAEFWADFAEAAAEVEALRLATPGPFIFGEHFSRAEAHVAPFLHRFVLLVEMNVPVPEVFLTNEQFKAWVDRVVNRESFQTLAPDRDTLRDFYAKVASKSGP